MKYTELKNSIKEGAKPVYLLEGDDAYFRSNGEEQLKAAFLQMPELNYTSFDGEALKGAAISQLVSAPHAEVMIILPPSGMRNSSL